ncbi:MAG: hypothetical protein C5B55_13195 [Blastocatellia bacterium]|nr:MAG: hypothetical protein C5B55_13195 [Blastocatellia bacterium]
MYLFYFLAALSIWVGIQSVLGGFRFARYVQRETSHPLPEFSPFVTVIAPSKGLDADLIENVRPLINQNYPEYEVIFVFDRANDPAAIEIGRLVSKPCTKTVIAGSATDSGQKVHNLSEALNHIDPRSVVLAFVDTDARPSENWLRQLVAPLADEKLGASSGYRWFVPTRGGFASRLRSIWNASIASALGANRQKNFCWGGSTAIRRETFERLNIRERWRGSVSDDYTVTSVLHEARLPIYFTPNCLVASVGDCDLHEAIEFTTRQIKITRVYAPQLWKPLLLGSSLFVIVFFGGWLLAVIRASLGSDVRLLIAVLLFLFALGAWKSIIRWRAVRLPLAHYRRELNIDLFSQIFLWPLASLLFLYNAIVAGFSRRIDWRGITYELKSPNETVIIKRDS